MKYLQEVELTHRGDMKGLVSYPEGEDPSTSEPSRMAFVWMDRERRYFVATGSSLNEGKPYTRKRWRQVDKTPNAEPEQVEFEIKQSAAAETFYDACAVIDQNNRERQDDLKLERKLVTQDWSKRVNISLLAMSIVDGRNLRKSCTLKDEDKNAYYWNLAEEMIDNKIDERVTRSSTRASFESSAQDDDTSPLANKRTGLLMSGTGTHLTPTKKRKKANGVQTTHTAQGRCKVCKTGRTAHICSQCEVEGIENFWICKPTQSIKTSVQKTCFDDHLKAHE